jgi:putative ABC transport system substrate-binding protein
MTKKALVSILAIFFLATVSTASAQQLAKVPRIGYLTSGRLDNTPENRKAFRQGLRDLGYVEGKSIVIEWRQGDWKRDHVPALAAELVRLKVDVIVTTGSWDTRVAKGTTTTIPIVMTNDADPVGNGFVASLARPGANITGLTRLRPELSGKRLELLKEIVPKLSRVAVFVSSTSQDYAQTFKQIELAAREFGLQLQYLDVLAPKDIESAFLAASKGGPRRFFSGCRVPSFRLTGQRLQGLLSKAGSRQYTKMQKTWKPVGSCPTAQIVKTFIVVRQLMWIKSSEVPSLPISPSSNRRSLNLLSI